MGRAPCCDKANVKKGPWSPEEDCKLKDFIEKHGTGGNWIALPHKAGLKRCGKSCRLRWLNYLRPNIKHGEFTDDEDRIICSLFATIGSRWSIIAAQLPGRTDNDIKNYWNTKLKKRLIGTLPCQRKPQQQQQQPPLPSPYEAFSPLQKSPTSLAGMPAPPDLFNATSCILQTHESFPIHYYHHHHHPHHSYQMKDGAYMLGGENSCSSSDGSCSQISYSKENGLQYGGGEQMGVNDGYLYGGLDETQKLFNGFNGPWGEVPLEYGYDEIKEVISTIPCSNGILNDASALMLEGTKPKGGICTTDCKIMGFQR